MAAKTYWVAAAVWTLVGGVVASPVGYAIGHNASSSTAQFEQPAPTAIAERAFPGTRINYVGSGTWAVPNQVPPGAYIVAAGTGAFGCSWELRTADDTKPKSVSTSGGVNRGGFDQFTVARTDRVLKLLGDCIVAAS